MGLMPDGGWTPVRLDRAAGEVALEWCFTAGYDFDDPFFDETIQRCLREPARLLFRRRTPLSQLLAALPERLPAPDGVIAHVSRCGSTLVTQVLGDRSDTVAWSEPPVIDGVVRAAVDGDCDVGAVRGMFALLAARGGPKSVVKLDAWTTLDLSVVRAALPTTPIAVLVRDPLEVLVSQAGRRGYHMIPGTLPPHRLGLRPEDLPNLDLDRYGAIVLGRIMAAAYSALAADPNAFVVDYGELPAAIPTIAARFGLMTDDAEARRLAERVQRDAKNPAVPFVADEAAKRDAATEAMRRAVDEWARPWYERVLEHRAGRR